jgi:hypothetical protein
MNASIQILFILTLGLILTWWFLNGLLNPFIDAVIAIVKCAVTVIFSALFESINKATKIYDANITQQIQKFKNRHQLSTLAKALIFFSFGVAVLILDQIYGRKFFNYDETIPFYPIIIQNHTYWISKYALLFGGCFIGISSLYFIGEILSKINKLLNHPIRISIVIYK